jgi:hypothetical protein
VDMDFVLLSSRCFADRKGAGVGKEECEREQRTGLSERSTGDIGSQMQVAELTSYQKKKKG